MLDVIYTSIHCRNVYRIPFSELYLSYLFHNHMGLLPMFVWPGCWKFELFVLFPVNKVVE